MNLRQRTRRLFEHEHERRRCALRFYTDCCAAAWHSFHEEARAALKQAARKAGGLEPYRADLAAALPPPWQIWYAAWRCTFCEEEAAVMPYPNLERIPQPPEEPPGLLTLLESEASAGSEAAARALLVLILGRGFNRYRGVAPQ